MHFAPLLQIKFKNYASDCCYQMLRWIWTCCPLRWIREPPSRLTLTDKLSIGPAAGALTDGHAKLLNSEWLEQPRPSLVENQWEIKNGLLVFSCWHSNVGIRLLEFKCLFSDFGLHVFVFKSWCLNDGTQMLVLKCWYSNVGTQLLVFCCHHSFQSSPTCQIAAS